MTYDNEKISICLSVTDSNGSYWYHLIPMMTSVMCNTKKSLNWNIICDTSISKQTRDVISRLVKAFDQEVSFFDVTNELDQYYEMLPSLRIYSKATLYRFFIPKFVKGSRVIYLDIDIIVSLDINELFSFDLHGKAIGAVLDAKQTRAIIALAYGRMMQLNDKIYCNAGVLLIDVLALKKIKAKTSWQEYLSIHTKSTMPDQDAINSIYRENIQLLPAKYNRIVSENYTMDRVEGNIWHFSGSADKAWNGIYCEAAKLYWKYLYLGLVKANLMDTDIFIKLVDNIQYQKWPIERLLHTQDCSSGKMFIRAAVGRIKSIIVGRWINH